MGVNKRELQFLVIKGEHLTPIQGENMLPSPRGMFGLMYLEISWFKSQIKCLW